MGKFSKRLSKTSTRLISKYGNDGVLTEVITGEYETSTSKTNDTKTTYNVKYVKEDFTTAEIQTGLYGISDFKAIIAYNKEIKKSWLLDGAKVINVEMIESQNDIIIQEVICRK